MIRANTTRVSLQPAYVLHHRPYRDSSLLLEIFTPDHGRVGLVARGARSPKSRLYGVLQPFQPLLISWVGRGELATLSGAEANGPPQRLQGKSVISGFYINELLLRLLHRHDPHAALFDGYARTLPLLAQAVAPGVLDRCSRRDSTSSIPGVVPPATLSLPWLAVAPGVLPPATLSLPWLAEQRALRIFEKHLLKEIGYALVLGHEVENGAPIEPDQRYTYRLEQGPVRSDGAGHGIALHGASLLSLMNEQLSDEQSLREVKSLMRAALALYLGDKPLQSRALLVNLQKTLNLPRSSIAVQAVDAA